MTAFFDQTIFVSDGQSDNKRIEFDNNSIVRNSLIDEKINFPTDTDHISLPKMAEEIKQQSIDESKWLIETELKKEQKRL